MWHWFVACFNPDGVGMGPIRLSYQEIESYSRLMRLGVTPYEAQLMRKLSEEYLKDWSRRNNNSNPSGPVKRTVEMTDSAGLKSMFMKVGSVKPKPKPKPKDAQ